ncbi:dynamin family protein [Microbacterium sp. Marseille-Q6965]|uniref:dynamin family protein n=1 Tax=Microbacterium sp. Marseille-Q6965 TaxID=2965072 RepID=UPI0021B805CA|nr:dynamin family protein [Microbacterium sp. Marseille-Q6965]
MSGDLRDVGEVIELAGALYEDDEDAVAVLDGYRARLREPLRLAVAGIVKAGKSTLLNALIGERIAPTDAGECTRVVTWYRHAPRASVTFHLHGGEQVDQPVRRESGRLVLDMGGYRAEDVARIEVTWPSESLRSTVLIDTPGIASLTEANSARSTDFLLPERTPSAADAIIYLLRHVHAEDVRFLEAFRDTAAGASETVNAVAVLSRADEIGSGRIDSLLSAAKIAERYKRDGELRALALDVIPLAGLLAEAGRTLRESEFIALRELAGLERRARDRLLVSADRFTRATNDTSLSVSVRRALLARFGLFGLRLGAALIRGGARTSSELAQRMVEQSGLVPLQRFVAEQFRARAVALKARAVLQGVQALLDDIPRAGTDDVRGAIERLTSRSHDLRELSLLAELRTRPPRVSADDLALAERLIGGAGTALPVRLGLHPAAGRDEQRAVIAAMLTHWRALAESPLSDRQTVGLCRLVVRSVEGMASEVGSASVDGAAGADVVLTSGPAQGAR